MARTLLIDDEELFRTTMEAALRQFGHDTVSARNGEEGVELFERQRFDLVITDLRLPGMSGPAVIKALRVLSPKARIIACGGGGTTLPVESHNLARQLGADRVLHKPFTTHELLLAIDEVLAGAKMPAE